jgi:hypothetical protein
MFRCQFPPDCFQYDLPVLIVNGEAFVLAAHVKDLVLALGRGIVGGRGIFGM